MQYIILYIILFFSFLTPLKADNKIDSLKTIIEQSNDTIKYDTYIELAKVYYYNDSFYQAIKEIKKAILVENIDTVRLARANNFLGIIYYKIGDNSSALEYHLKSLRYREALKDEKLLATAYNAIGLVYTSLDEFEISNDYFLKSLEIEKKYNNTTNIAMIYNNISTNYFKQGDYNKTLEYLLKSEEIINDTDLNKSLLLVNIGDVYRHLGEIKKAKEYLFTAIDYSKKTKNKHYLSLAYCYLGELFLSQKDARQARFFFEKSMRIAKEMRVLDVLKDNYKGLVNTYTLLNNSDSVLKYNNFFFAINDSIFNNQTADKIAELQIKYEFDKKEKEIENLIIKNQLADRNQKIIIAFFVLLILVLIIIFLIINNKRRKTHADKLAVEQNVKIIKYEDVIDNSLDEIVDNKKEEPKDSNSALSEEFKTMLEVSISKKIRKDKLYLKSDFTLDELAKLLETNRRYVSQVINERFEKNFSSFINEFRIKEAMRLMSNPEYNKYTIDSISKLVGFNSISAFNGAFKKVTGLTPSTFVKSLNN